MAQPIEQPPSDFIHDLAWRDVPLPVRDSLQRSLIDLLATLVSGTQTKASQIIREYSAALFSGGQAQLAFDGRTVAPAGAALANATTLDSMDSHDGHRLAKGHAGAGSLASALATCSPQDSGREFLLRLLIGYEIGLRAAVALHASSSTYHSSGSWVALAAAAIAARSQGLGTDQTRHALGIAEYHGPRSPMMRCIDQPTMVKDGTGWGAMTGLMAAELAAAGFTGAPAELLLLEHEGGWTTLGYRWRIFETYYKPYPTCRWAQPAVAAALALQRKHQLEPAEIKNIRVETFAAASRLDHPAPATTEEAQYSLPFPLAVALLKGHLDPPEVMGEALFDKKTIALAQRVRLTVDPDLEAAFPEKTFARVTITTTEGSDYRSEVHNAPGEADAPLSDSQLIAKYQRYTRPLLGSARSDDLLYMCRDLENQKQLERFLDLTAKPLVAAASH